MPSLSELRRSPLPCLLSACALGSLLASCAGSTERLVMKDTAAASGRLARLDLLPVDFYVQLDDTDTPTERERQQVNAEVSASIETYLRRFLEGQGYALGNRITWDGASGAHGFVGGPEIRNLALDILDFVNAESLPEGEDAHGAYVTPDLLRTLAAATGGDAVLYVNGKASVETDDKKAQKAFVAICCFIAAAATLLLIYSGSKSSSSSSGRAVHAGRPGGHRVHGGPPVRHAPRHVHRGPNVHVGFYSPIFIHNSGPAGSGYVVEQSQEEREELSGDRLWISFTLVRSSDGLVLWHGRKVLDLSATDDGLLHETMAELLQSFPAPSAGAAAPTYYPTTPAPAPASSGGPPQAPAPAAPYSPPTNLQAPPN